MFKLAGRLGLILVAFGLGLIVFFVSAGSHVDDRGLLVEEFWAWASGISLVIVGTSGLIASMLLPKITNRLRGIR